MFAIRNGPRSVLEQLPSGVEGAVLGRLDDLWLVASGPGLVLLDTAAGERSPRHLRAAAAADRLRRDLFELLTVAPFVEALVVVPDDAVPGPDEVPADLVHQLVSSGPLGPAVAQVGAMIDAGSLSLPWRRHRPAPVAG